MYGDYHNGSVWLYILPMVALPLLISQFSYLLFGMIISMLVSIICTGLFFGEAVYYYKPFTPESIVIVLGILYALPQFMMHQVLRLVKQKE